MAEVVRARLHVATGVVPAALTPMHDNGSPNIARRLGPLGAQDTDLGTVTSQLARCSGADTTTAHGRLMLTVLGGLAEFERELSSSPRARYPSRDNQGRAFHA